MPWACRSAPFAAGLGRIRLTDSCLAAPLPSLGRVACGREFYSLLVLVVLLLVHVSVVDADQPRVRALVPGLTIRRLPVDLTNINSVEYGPDVRLYAAGYDGCIHVLSDTDGDGVEDRAELF